MPSEKRIFLLSLPWDITEIGKNYLKLPLQCTLCPPFETSRLKDIVAGLKAISETQTPLKLEVSEKDKVAYKIVRSKEIELLHNAVLGVLKNAPHTTLPDLESSGNKYQPQMTYTEEMSVSVGDVKLVKVFILIQILEGHMYPVTFWEFMG